MNTDLKENYTGVEELATGFNAFGQLLSRRQRRKLKRGKPHQNAKTTRGRLRQVIDGKQIIHTRRSW